MFVTRRQILRSAAPLVASSLVPAWAPAAATKKRLKFAVVGINHEHVFRMVQAVREGGGELAMIYADKPDPNHGAKFFQENPDVPRAREEREVLEAREIALIVTAARPAERAQTGIRAMRAGKDVLADKGGFLTRETLAEARRVQAETRRIYSISYNERLLLPVSIKIDELLKQGAIGKVTHMDGQGPHGLFGHGPREDWFWTRAGHGGILLDTGTHQADQFLYYVGAEGVQVVEAVTKNRENPDHPEFEDYGRMTLKSKAGTGEAVVTYDKAKTPGFVLTLTGTEGRMEVHKHAGLITVTKKNGSKKEYRVDTNLPCPFGPRLVDDVLNRTETAMPQAHTFLASELAVRAQWMARKP